VVEKVQPATPVVNAGDADSQPKKGGSGMKALLRAAPQLALPGLAAIAVFFVGCKILRMSELDEMVAFAKEKLKRKKTKPPQNSASLT
jgi:hypothetical protein